MVQRMMKNRKKKITEIIEKKQRKIVRIRKII
jgi:hypothetical protein